MAFKLRHSAFCDLCKKSQEVWAFDEDHANTLLKRDHNWDAEGNAHVCTSCKEDASQPEQIAS
ncbi:hypothetical protein BM526_19260 (plasmid) [Alteromonas mediterranea]|uniref:hypothetical protein n=1 Tax=Alteromonas mediterranea TaxID=314275 RepID=UPI0009035088|nr:hypothetical protein [Alteromonas mediterranea]APE04109.1 hypothetical protein BM526_19260 [Alteromonas mediterranea]